ncbi:MAG: hypothetical protein RIC55_07470 [Pirellulaceae bacterium]
MDRRDSPNHSLQTAAELGDLLTRDVRGLADDASRRRFAWSLLCRGVLWRVLASHTESGKDFPAKSNSGQRNRDDRFRSLLATLLDEAAAPTNRCSQAVLRLRAVYLRFAAAVFDQSLAAEFPGAALGREAAEGLLTLIATPPAAANRSGQTARSSTSHWLESLLTRFVDRKRSGAFYTPDDVADYMATRAVLPLLLRRAAESQPETATAWRRLMREHPRRYGLEDRRDTPSASKAKRMSPEDAVALNLDLPTLVHDTLATGGDEIRLAMANVLRGAGGAAPFSVLDPTCGAGAFLDAAAGVLAPIYEACKIADGAEAVAAAITHNLHGVDLAREAVETCRLRLLLKWLHGLPPDADLEQVPDVRAAIRCGNALVGTLVGAVDDENVDDEVDNASHSLLHWSVEFPQVMRRGGFDAVIGNPPYVEYTRSGVTYPLPGAWRTRGCDNLHALVSERSAALLHSHGAFAFIVPAASVCTPRMRPLVDLWQARFRRLWISLYDERPGKLFSGVDQQLAIVIGHDAGPCREQFVTPMRHWATRSSNERRELFTSIPYQAVDPALRVAGVIPKVGRPLELELLERLREASSLTWRAAVDAEPTTATIFYKNAGGRYWRLVKTFPTRYRSDRGAARTSTEIALPVRAELAALVVCCLSSSLFYWYWRVASNCRHLTERELAAFPIPESLASPECLEQFTALCARYEKRLKQTRIRKTTDTARNGRIVQDEYRVAAAKPILDEIDAALAPHYGLSDRELEFVINYDLRYRLAGRRSRSTTRPAPAPSPP